MQKLKIAIISTFFDTGLGYQEVQYARVCARLGYEVTVFSTTHDWVSLEDKNADEYEIVRCENYLNLGNTIYPLGDIKNRIRDGSWDVAFVLGPNHLFPWVLTKQLNSSCKVVTYFGDHPMNISSPLMRRLLKNRWYRWMIERSDLIIPAVPPTVEILEGIVGKDLVRPKIHHLGLVIDPHEMRLKEKKDFGFLSSVSKVIATVTVVRGKKEVIPFLQQISFFLQKHPEWEFVLMGLVDNEKSREAEAYVAKLQSSKRMHLLPLGNRQEVVSLYSRATLGVWFSETISIQQAMMAGLPIVVPDTPTLRHLVKKDVNGFIYGDASQVTDWTSNYYPVMIRGLADALGANIDTSYDRKALKEWNQMVDAEIVLDEILEFFFSSEEAFKQQII